MKTQKIASFKDGSPLQKKAHFSGTVTFGYWISANIPYKDTYKFYGPSAFREFTQRTQHLGPRCRGTDSIEKGPML